MTAYSFPQNPVNGEKYPPDESVSGRTQYRWDASKGVWNIVPPYVRLGNQASYNGYEWPLNNGDLGQQLTTDGEGNLAWENKGVSFLSPLELNAPTDGVRFQFTLLDGNGDPYAPTPESNIVVFLGGVPQVPNVAFTLDGDEITFSEPPPVGVNFYAVTSVSI